MIEAEGDGPLLEELAALILPVLRDSTTVMECLPRLGEAEQRRAWELLLALVDAGLLERLHLDPPHPN